MSNPHQQEYIREIFAQYRKSLISVSPDTPHANSTSVSKSKNSRQTEAMAQPLKDLNHRKLRSANTLPSLENTMGKTYNKRLTKGISQHGNMDRSKPATNVLNRKSFLAAAKENTPFKSPRLGSQRSLLGQWMNAPLIPYQSFSSRKNDAAGSATENLRWQRRSLATNIRGKTPPSCSSMKILRPPSSRKKIDYSFFKRMKPFERDQRRELAEETSEAGQAEGSNGEKECRRTLDFNETLDERDESTQPLPVADLTTLMADEDAVSTTSFLHGSQKVDLSISDADSKSNTLTSNNTKVASVDIKGEKTRENTFLITSSSQQRPNLKRRTSSIPIMVKRSTSPVVECSAEGQEITRSRSKLPTKENYTKRRNLRKSKPLPQIKITRPSLSSGKSCQEDIQHPDLSLKSKSPIPKPFPDAGIDLPKPPPNSPMSSGCEVSPVRQKVEQNQQCNLNSITELTSQILSEKIYQHIDRDLEGTEEESHCVTVEDKCMETDQRKRHPTVIENDLLLKEQTTNDHPGADEKSSNERNKTLKDASTNTILTTTLFQRPFLDVEEKIEETLLQQNRVLDSFEELVKDMKEMFNRKADLLLEEYRVSLNPIKALREQLLEALPLQNSLPESEDTVFENDGETKSENLNHTHVYTKFLGTPLHMKNRRRTNRSFSHPPSPELTTNAGSREESFCSLESVSMSPFTHMVGDCDRPSLIPMTPMTRLNVTSIKKSLTDQLQSLYD